MIDIYRAFFKTTLAVQLQYRVGLMIWMIEIILQPTIYLVVWTAAAGGGEISGFGAREFAGYYITLLVVDHFTQMWQMWEFEWLIRQGQMSMRLLRPLHPIHTDIVQNISFKLLMLIIVVPTVILLSLVFQPILTPQWWAVLLFIPALLLAGGLAFFAGWIVALAAFWTTRIMAINLTYFLILVFFSGYIAPLDLLPPVLRTIADILPFRWIIAYPVELLQGRLELERALMGIGMQVFWLALIISMLGFVWRAGVRRYGAVGG